MGVEPTTGAWEATVLPLHYGRVITKADEAAPSNVVILALFCRRARVLFDAKERFSEIFVFCSSFAVKRRGRPLC